MTSNIKIDALFGNFVIDNNYKKCNTKSPDNVYNLHTCIGEKTICLSLTRFNKNITSM